MRNPSQPFPVNREEPPALTPREVVAFTSLSRHWAGKPPRMMARGVAAALDAALHPAVIVVTLGDPKSGDAVMAIDGQERDHGGASAEQWRELLTPWLQAEAAAGAHVVNHPTEPRKLKLLVSAVGVGRVRGHIGLISGDPAFPRARDELLLEVATHQLSLALEPAGAAPEGSVAASLASLGGQAQDPQLQLVADTIPALLAYVDRDQVYRFVNRRYQDWFGRAPADIIGRRVAEVIGAPAHAKVLPAMKRALAGEHTTYEARLFLEAGGERVVYGNYVPDVGADGEVHGFFALVQDITERKRVEQALSESEARFRNLADTAPVMIWMTDEHKRSAYFNKRWLEFLGQSFEQALSEDWSQYLHPDDRDQALTCCGGAFEARVPFTVDFRIRRHDGAYRWVHDCALPRFDPDGTFRGFIGTMVDITERKELEEERTRTLHAEREARAEAELLRDLGNDLNAKLDVAVLLQRVTDAATAVVGAEFGAFFYNTVDEAGEAYALYTLSGAPREAFAQFPVPRGTALFGPTFRGEAVVRCDDVRKDPRYGKSAPYHGMPPGHLPVCSYLAVPVRSRSGEVLGGLFFGHASPGRFQERHERIVLGIAAQAAVAIDNVHLFGAVREQAERLKITYEQAPVGIVEADLDGGFQAVNDRFCQILGYRREELLGRYFKDVTDPADRSAELDKFRALLAGEMDSYQHELRFTRKDGRRIWGRLSVGLVRDAEGRPRYGVGLLEDITARRHAEERAHFLAEASKRLAASLDYKETLVYIAGLAVPDVADWCAIDVVQADGSLARIAVAPAGESGRWSGAPGDRQSAASGAGPRHVIAHGSTELMPGISDAELAGLATDHEQLDALRGLALSSYICAPLSARERVLGAVTFAYTGPSRELGETDRAFVEELGRRIAVAIDNALLFEAARAQAQRLQATYDHAPIGIAETALDGRFLRVNDRYCAISGYRHEELLHMRFVDVTYPDEVAASEARYRDLIAGQVDAYQVEKRYRRKDGSLVWVHVTLSLVRDAHGRPEHSVAVVEDITDRRRAEIVIGGQKHALEQMAQGEPLAAVLQTLTETFDRQSTAQVLCSVSLHDKDARVLRPVASARLPAEWLEAIREVPVGPQHGSAGVAAASGEAVFVADIATDPRWEGYREVALHLGFRAGWSACLHGSDGRVLGTFDVLCREARTPAADELRFMELIADTAAIAIERYQGEKALQLQAQVLSRIHDAVVVLDTGGRVLQWNEGATRLFGFAAAEALGQHLSALCAQPDHYHWLEEHVLAPLMRDGRYERVAPLRRRSGELLHAHMAISLLRDAADNPNTVVAYILDVTERVHAERELAVRVRQQEAVARLGQLALSGIGLEELMGQAVRLVADTLSVELCKVLELLPDGEALLLRAGVGWQEGLVGHGTVSAGGESQAGFTLMANEPVVVADLRRETRFSGPPLLHDHGVVSGMSVVIHGDAGRPYGVLGSHSTQARAFSAYDVNFLQSIAHILAAGIQRKQLEAAMAQARDDLERRVEERTAELARTNQSLRDEVVERMGVEAALRESEAQYRMLFERNPVPAWVFDIHTRNILAANETAIWQYGYTREEFLRMNIHDLHPPEEASRALDYAEQFPPETAYIGVWKHRKQDETVIDVEMFVYEVLFQGRWARLMLANDITERRRAEQEFRVLETITRAVSEARDLDAALYAILRHVCDTTGWVLGEAWLPAPNQEVLRCSRAWYYGAEGLEEFRHAAWELELTKGDGLIGRAWSTGQPIWVPDVTEDETFRRAPSARAAKLRAGIAFPVLAEGEIVALLAFYLREPRLEDEHQVKLVTTIATQAGLAIQRKRAEERLRESEERFRLLVEGAHDYAIYMLDADGRVASWNRGAERLKGYSVEEVIGQPVALFYPPEDAARQLPQQALAEASAEGVYEGEGWRIRKSGERFWASTTITALRGADGGALLGFVKVTRDVTERKQAEERLKESEARLARAQEFSLLMVAHAGLDGRWLKVPQMLCATLAYREEELLAARFEDVTHPDDFPAEWEHCERLIRGEAKSFDLEKRFLRRDGKIVWVYQNTSIVLDAQDRPLHFLTFIRDITQRKEAEEQLRRSEIQLAEAQRLAHLGSWEWDIATGRIEWSDELYRIYGVVPGTPISYDMYVGFVHPEDRERVNRTISAALESHQPFTLEERIARPDGELRYLLSHGAAVNGPKGEVARMVGVCLDITERKRAEERLREYTHRLESLSQRLLEAQETERRRIARELHDQIGQDLSVIKINLQALRRLPGAAGLTSHLDETVRIVEGVLTTARNLSVELRPSMLDDLGLVAALRWYLDRQVQRSGLALHFVVDSFEFRLAATIETACFRLAQEALTNILRHAEARHVHVTLQTVGEELEMRIMDDGKGFDVEAARVRASQGESFGLLGMEERALLAGGRLEIVSIPGQGTTVIARFPLTLNSVRII